MSQKTIKVTVLRLSDTFNIRYSKPLSVSAFKDLCRKFSKLPINEFSIIINGKEVKEDNKSSILDLTGVNRVYLFVKSFVEKIKELTDAEILKLMFKEKFSDPYQDFQEEGTYEENYEGVPFEAKLLTGLTKFIIKAQHVRYYT